MRHLACPGIEVVFSAGDIVLALVVAAQGKLGSPHACQKCAQPVGACIGFCVGTSELKHKRLAKTSTAETEFAPSLGAPNGQQLCKHGRSNVRA